MEGRDVEEDEDDEDAGAAVDDAGVAVEVEKDEEEAATGVGRYEIGFSSSSGCMSENSVGATCAAGTCAERSIFEV